MERLMRLTKAHKEIRDYKNIVIQVYTNATGFLWSMCMVDSGTDLGWSDFNGDCEHSGAFTSYENALEDAINLINECDLEKYKEETPFEEFHWGNYADHLNRNYRGNKKKLL